MTKEKDMLDINASMPEVSEVSILTSSVVLLLSFKKEYDTLKVTNPLGISRLKRKTILEYLLQRIEIIEQEIAEVSKARAFLQEQEEKLDENSRAMELLRHPNEKLDEDNN